MAWLVDRECSSAEQTDSDVRSLVVNSNTIKETESYTAASQPVISGVRDNDVWKILTESYTMNEWCTHRRHWKVLWVIGDNGGTCSITMSNRSVRVDVAGSIATAHSVRMWSIWADVADSIASALCPNVQRSLLLRGRELSRRVWFNLQRTSHDQLRTLLPRTHVWSTRSTAHVTWSTTGGCRRDNSI